MSQPTLLLKGSFDSFSIDDVLDVVGMSRQTMRVVLNDDGRGGEFLVKAGRVIHAEAPPDRGRRAFVNIYREPGQGFAVWQHVEAIGEPIGMLADLIEEAKALEETPVAPSRTPMLAGTFSDHRLDEVLDVLNMTRQLVEFKCYREDESSVIMLLKSGQVLACEDLRDSSNGLPAFKSLFKDPGQSFEVVRLDARAHGDLPPRIGTLGALVAEARKNDDQEGKKRPGVLFQGAFKNFPLSDVLEALSVTRLTVEMVFHDSDGTRGTFVLKAGQVLAAQALRTGASHREAFIELMTEPGESFIVVRRPGIPTGEPIGRLRDLLSETRTAKRKKKKTVPPSTSASASTSGSRRVTKLRPAPPPVPRSARTKVSTPPPPSKPAPATSPVRERQPTKRSARGPAVPPPVPTAAAKPKPKAKPTPKIAGNKPVATIPRKSANSVEIVLDGTFDNFSIDDVLEVLGISRQYVALGTLRNGAPLARLVVKSGRLLMASYGSVKDPKKAIRMLLDDPGTEFRVRRLPRYADNDLGSFAELVEGVKREKEASTVIHLPNKAKPAPKPEPEPEPEPDLGVDLDELFAEEDPPAPKPPPRKPKGAKKPYRPPERKKKVEAKAPETEATEAKATEAKAPETKAPEAKAPEAKAPEAKKPEAKKPEAKKPEAKKPEAKKPEAKKPEPEPEAKKPEPEPAPEAKKPEPTPAPVPEAKKPEPTPEAKKPEPVSDAPAKVAASAAAPIAASPEANDAIVQSLQVIEQRLREGSSVGNEDAVKALHQIDTHIGTLTDSVKELAKHVDQMRDKMVAEAKTTRLFLQLLSLIGIGALVLMILALRG